MNRGRTLIDRARTLSKRSVPDLLYALLWIEPFNFPAPLAVIDDIPTQGRSHPDKRLCVWRLNDVPSCR